jgi:sortase A
LARKRSVNDLSSEELRRLLLEKRKDERRRRMDAYHRSGRIVLADSQPILSPMESIATPMDDAFPQENKRSGMPKIFDRLLLVVEVAAVIGLAFILFNGVSLLRNLNTEVAIALEQPTLTPTPLIYAVILPSGHNPPGAPGAGQFNDAEIPEHLLPIYQSLAKLPIPTPSAESAVRIQIPAITVDAPIVMGDGEEQLKKGVGQNNASVNPGEDGNLILSAHNDIYGEIFRYLDKLVPGDEIIVYTNQRSYVYIVRQVQVVEPTKIDVIAPTDDPVVTLISCYPYMRDTQRIVVSADLSK